MLRTMVADLAPARSTNGPLVIGLSLFGLLAFILWLWALINLLRRPAFAFEAAHISRALWLVLLIGSLFCGLSWLVAIIYLFFVDPRVNNQSQIRRGPGFPGYP